MVNNMKVQRALALVAAQNGTTVEEVREEIQAVIRETSPEALIAFVADIIAEKAPEV